MSISKRNILKQIKKIKERIVVEDAMDWCVEFNSNDANFIRCCISDYLPELLSMSDDEIQSWCIETGVHNLNDLAELMCVNLEIGGE